MSTSTALAGLVSADVLAAHLQEIIVEYDSYRKQFRRADNREPVAIPVEAVELDDELRPISKPFHMVTRDISVSGAGILHTADVDCRYLRLQFSSPVTLEAFGVEDCRVTFINEQYYLTYTSVSAWGFWGVS